MIDIDTHWMAASTKTLFEEAVQTYAEAIKSGSMPAMQSGENLMRKASQAQIQAEEQPSETQAGDPGI